jgi:hypothetical protein
MRPPPNGASAVCALVFCVLMLLLAAPAVADATGKGLLEGKNTAKQTLDLDGVKIRVTDQTRIYDGDAQPMGWAQIPDPGLRTSVVEYSGSMSGSELVARKLVIYHPPH